MGGKLFAPHSQRVTNDEIKVIFDELNKKLSKYFTSMALSRSIKSKMDHGDIDIIVLPKTHIDFKSVLEKELGKDLLEYSKNGYVYSFLYNSPVNKKVHVDLIAANSEEDAKSKTEYFSFNDFSAIVGMLARKLRFKYTDNGFYKKYQDEKGNYHDFLISRNLMDGLKILGLDPSKFNKIEGQDDILNFVLETPLMDKKFFEYTELVRRDREAFDVRPGVEEINKKIVDSGKTRQIEDDDYFFKKYFPQKYSEYLTEVEETNKKNNIQKKYSGQWLMNKFGMKPGPEMGKVLKKITDKFKDNLENTSEEEVSNFVKSLMDVNENKINYKEFFSYLKEDVSSKTLAYHVTYKANLSSIRSKGILPQIPKDMNDEKAIYLFKTREDVENALMNWLGDRFEDDDKLVLLTVDITGLNCKDTVEYEWACTDLISPDRIIKVQNI